MLKKPLISPTQPRRAETRRSAGKAASESKPEEVPTTLRGAVRPCKWILANGKTPPAFPTSENLIRYVEDFDEPRTKHGKRRASARRGWAGEKGDFFSILLLLLGTADRGYHSPACDTLGYLSGCSRGSVSSEPIPFGSCPLPQRRAESDGCSISSHYLSRSPDSCGSDGAGPPWPASCMER